MPVSSSRQTTTPASTPTPTPTLTPAFLLPSILPVMPTHTPTPRRKPHSHPTSPNTIQTPLRPPTASSSSSDTSERSTRNGKLYRTFAYPPVRPPTRPQTPLTQTPTHPANANRHYVFVYGTLKHGFANAHYLDRATFLGHFRTMTRYPLVVGGKYHSPYLLDLPSKGSKVKGELYAVDDATLADLDHLENVGVNYSRRIAKVSNTADRAFVAEAFVYFKVNAMDHLVDKPFMDDYQCTKYVPRHLRQKEPVAVGATR